MKNLSIIRAAGLGMATAGAMMAAQTVSAKEFAGGEISGSAAVSNVYLFRGFDVGDGAAGVSGSLDYSHETGLYAGAWVTSQGAGSGIETDLYLGYAVEIEGLTVDINVTNYVYPSGAGADNLGDFSEIILTLGYSTDDMGFSFQYADNVAGANGYVYYALGMDYGDFNVTLGVNDFDEPVGQLFDEDVTHLDITYAYNENLSFTVSKIVDLDDELNANKTGTLDPFDPMDPLNTGPENKIDDDTLFVVTYSLPIE